MMKPPIFLVVASNGDLLAFASSNQVEHYVESVDVENGEYGKAFDSEGRLLALEVERPSGRHRILGLALVELTAVRLAEKEAQPSHEADLASVLRSALARLDGRKRPAEATLTDLVEEAFNTFRIR